MSSTRTMSRSLERPTMICRSSEMGNSPPWYFPLMKRKTYERPSILGAIGVGALGDGSCIDGVIGGDGGERGHEPGAMRQLRGPRERRGNSGKKRVMGAKLNGQVDDPMSHDRTSDHPSRAPSSPGSAPTERIAYSNLARCCSTPTLDLDAASFAQMAESVRKAGRGG